MARALPLERLLIVEDQPSLRRSLERGLGDLAREVRSVGSVEAAREALHVAPVDALVLDVALPDGTAFDILETVRALKPTPVVVAISGAAIPLDTFRLAQAGVRAYLPKPLTLETLDAALRDALAAPPDVTPLVLAQVGHVPVHDVEKQVRRAMVQEALARAGGNRRGAARLLSISRQLLQHILKRDEDQG